MIKNIYNTDNIKLEEEFFEDIIKTSFPDMSVNNIKLERIISVGHITPEGFVYDQDQNEFVLLLKGCARIAFEDEEIDLNEGDYLIIPAHKKHRVTYTSQYEKTFWLTLYF